MKKIDFSKLLKPELGAVVMIVFGVVLLWNPDFGSAAVGTVLGWILIGGGAVGLLIGVLSWPGLGFGELIGSLALLGIGIYLVKDPLALASGLGLLLGIFLVCQGGGAFGRALRLRRRGGHWIPGMVLAVLMTVLGLRLVFSPMTTSRVVMAILGVVLIACGIGSLVSRSEEKKYIHGGSDGVIDADE